MADDLTFDEFRKNLAKNLNLEQEKRQKQLKGELKPKKIIKTKIVRRTRKSKLPKRLNLSGLKKAFDPRIRGQFPKKKLRRNIRLRYPQGSNLSKEEMLQEFYRQKQEELMRARTRQTQQSNSYRAIMQRLRAIQNKSKLDDAKQQRLRRERASVGSAMSLLKTPFIFKDHQLDMTGVQSENILNAPNSFKENPENNILRLNGRRNILDSGEFTLRF